MKNKEIKIYLYKINQIYDWYRAQYIHKDGLRLFKGEDNEMTNTNMYFKMMHYSQLRRNLRAGNIKQHHLAKIDRAFYMNVIAWPLDRIKKRAEKVAKFKEAA